ncbi:hypothetical protein [Chlorella virus XW01]|nr:hypothetical protein [Chlorella virus XW01]
MSYQEKYLKYKKKYLNLKKQQGMKGGFFGFKLGQENFTETGLPNTLSPLESELEGQQQQTMPDQTAQVQTVPDQTAQVQTVPDQTAQVQTVPDQTAQVQTVPDQTTQVQTMPDQTAQVQTVPDQTAQVQAGGFFGFKLGVEKMTETQLPDVLSPLESDTEQQNMQPPVEQQNMQPPVEQPMAGGKNHPWMEDSDLELSSVTDLSSSDSLSDFGL